MSVNKIFEVSDKINKTVFKFKKLIIGLVLLVVLGIVVFNLALNNIIKGNVLKIQLNNYFAKEFEKYKTNYNLSSKEVGISIDGNIFFTSFPKTIITMTNVRFNNLFTGHNSVNGNVKTLMLRVKLLPLLFKKLEIIEITLNKTDIEVFTNEKLVDEYNAIVKVKKTIKADKNEVSGIGDKLKEMMNVENDKNLKLGFRDIFIDEEQNFKVDNKPIEEMLVTLFKRYGTNSMFSFVDVDSIISNNTNVSFYREEKLIKKITNITGNMFISNKKFSINTVQMVENEIVKLSLNLNLNKDNLIFDVKFGIKDIISAFDINFKGKAVETTDIDTWIGEGKIDLNINTLSEFIKIFTYSNSELYKKIINNDKTVIKGKIDFNNNDINLKEFIVKSNNIDLSTTFSYKSLLDVNVDIKKFNIDSFLLKDVKEKSNDIEYKDIYILNADTIEQLTKKIVYELNIKNNINIKAKLDNITYNNKLFVNNLIDLTIDKKNIKINDCLINIKDDLEFKVSNPTLINSNYVHTVSVKGKNILTALDLLNVKIKNIKQEPFDLTSNLVLTPTKIIFFNSKLTGKNLNADIDVEYDFKPKNSFTAINLTMNDLSLENITDNIIKIEEVKKEQPKEKNTKKEDNKTKVEDSLVKKANVLKEKLLYLNNLNNNIYLNVKFNNISYKEQKNVNLNAFFKIDKGYIKTVIKRADMFNMRNLNGTVIFDLNTDFKSQIFTDLKLDDIDIDINLLPYIINFKKYLKILTKDSTIDETSSTFWINLLFKMPILNEIFGNCNIFFKNGKINNVPFNNFEFKSIIDDGIFKLQNFEFEGFGGRTNIAGNVDLKQRREINLIFKKTIYNLEDIQRIVLKEDDPYLKGIVGLGGYVKAFGERSDEFISSLDMYFEVVGNTFYVKQLGIRDLQYALSDIFRDKELLYNINAKDMLINNNSGTIFKNFKAKFFLQKEITTLSLEANGTEITNKLLLTINNANKKNILINMINTSVFFVDINDVKIPLYVYISFKEDLVNKAILDINVDQVNEYLKEIKNKVEQIDLEKQIQNKDLEIRIEEETKKRKLKEKLDLEAKDIDNVIKNDVVNNAGDLLKGLDDKNLGIEGDGKATPQANTTESTVKNI